MKITIAEAVNLLSQLNKKVNELDAERNRVATETIDKGETAAIPARSVDVISAEMEEVDHHILELKACLRAMNQETYVEWSDVEVPIAQAIEIAKTLRARAEKAKRLGQRKKLERNNGGRFGIGGDTTTFTVALYDPEAYKAEGQKLEREANKLSALIEKANHATEFSFEPADVYLA